MDEKRPAEARDDAAVFATARVRSGTGPGARFATILVTLAVGGPVLAGVLDGPPGTALDADAEGPAATSMVDVPAVSALPEPTVTAAPGGPALLVVHTRAWGRYVFVHGEVFLQDAEVVVVLAVDDDEGVVASRTVELPKGSTALRLGANDRFQLAFEIDGGAATEVAYVQATAYDALGRRLAFDRRQLSPPDDPGWWRSEGAEALGPTVTSEDGAALALAIGRSTDTIFVRGVVAVAGVTRVTLNVVNSEGRVAGWSEVRRPDAGLPSRGRPSVRFDVEIAVPDWSHGPLWVEATAFDATGEAVAAERIGVWPDGSAVLEDRQAVVIDGAAISGPAILVTPTGRPTSGPEGR